ncbi:MAG: hypothetical protein AAFP80_10905 [Pseudomonadota bacterium]
MIKQASAAQLKAVLRARYGPASTADVQFKNANQSSAKPWLTGVAAIDECLPEGGLSRAGLHEIEPLKPSDMPSLTGFGFALLSRLASTKPIIWCVTASQVGDYGQPYAFGLSRFGISPSQIIFAKVAKDKELPFALEEAIKTQGIAAVIGEGSRPCFTGSRRIALLCQTHQTPCLFMTPRRGDHNGSAALTRWQIAPQQGVEDPRDPFGPGLPSWAVGLPRARAGRAMPGMEPADLTYTSNHTQPYPWRIIWDDQTLSFRPASVLRHRATHQTASQQYDAQKAMVGR